MANTVSQATLGGLGVKKTLDKHEGVIKNGQYSVTGNIGWFRCKH